ncbi:MAG: MFS transporter [Clostridia bacterium]|nr:MFS transporter [Clostridia bacterium]
METKNYKKTLITCYIGFITQAIVANFTPLLFLRFHAEFDIPIAQIALISTVFYIAQILVDVFCAKFVDRIGYRKCVVASQITSAAGLISLAFLPSLLPSRLLGILISVMFYALGSGLIEVLVSPIVEACPFENKGSVMSLLHSFYCWGVVGVVLVSTLFFALFGIEKWRIMACLWAIVPLINAYNFSICPIERLAEEGKGMTLKELLGKPAFWVFIILMIGAGASEASMAQWASAFVESALGFSKSIGDLIGPCMFAATMGLSRLLYGKVGHNIKLLNFMLGSGALCLICYLMTAISSLPIFGLLGCILCGFSVGIMWPGSISISSARMPLGGTALFALLAMGGDLGASIGPSVIGIFTQNANDNMKAGMLAGIVFPILLIVAIFIIKLFIPSSKHDT